MFGPRQHRPGLGAPIALASVVLVLSCAAPPRPVEFTGPTAQPDTTDGLYRVKSARVAALFLRPGTDFAAYHGVLLDRASVTPMNEEKAARRARGRRSPPLTPDTIDRFERIFAETLESGLAQSAYTLVREPGPDVLRVSGLVVDLLVDTPNYRGGEESTFVLQAGEMTLVLDVRDSTTGVSLARIVDPRPIVPAGTSLSGGYRSSPVRTWSAVRDVFEGWARVLREDLDALHELPPVPDPHGEVAAE